MAPSMVPWLTVAVSVPAQWIRPVGVRRAWPNWLRTPGAQRAISPPEGVVEHSEGLHDRACGQAVEELGLVGGKGRVVVQRRRQAGRDGDDHAARTDRCTIGFDADTGLVLGD